MAEARRKKPTATKPAGSTTKGKPARANTAKAKTTKPKTAKARTTKAKEPAKPSLPTLDDALQWNGLQIDGLGNKTLGRIAGIHVDAQDGKPRWVLVRIGPLAGCTAIPFEHVAEGAGRLWAAYDKDWIREAPRFRPSESLTALQELELCEHWGIREGEGRAAEVADQDAEAITAVPAEN
jgi:hypothetical protein